MMKFCLLLLSTFVCGSFGACWYGGDWFSDGTEWPCETCQTCSCKESVFTATQNDCRVNAAWTKWASWSACSTTCNKKEEGKKGTGFRTRRRTCIEGKHGGSTCADLKKTAKKDNVKGKLHKRPCTKNPDCLVATVPEALALVIENKENCFEENTDYPGNDINLETVKENLKLIASDCQDLCSRTDDCKAFTWSSSNQRCYLKSSKSGTSSEQGAISGPKNC